MTKDELVGVSDNFLYLNGLVLKSLLFYVPNVLGLDSH